MGEAARALDDVSDHLGEVLRRADDLLVEWSRFGAQVRTQVDREVAEIGDVVDGAVARAASAGLDRAIADRLRALTAELERLEQRTRAASRAASERREADRRVLWVVVAGIVLANALLVAVLLRRPDVAPVAEPMRMESPAAEQTTIVPAQGNAPAAGSADTASAATTESTTGSPDARSPAPSAGSNSPSTGGNVNAGSNAPNAGATAGSNAVGAKPGAHVAPNAPAQPMPPSSSTAKQPAETAGQAKPTASPMALPPKGGNPRPHKKLP